MSLCALPSDTVRLIKSTQVITTPLSIVKELVENSIDAGATTVSVKLESYGFGRIEIRDNGKGISEEDVSVVAKPHFTSKISSFADLSSLTSYGFRGEALSSLCAVADVTITTKTKESPMGHIYTFTHHGDVASKKPAAMAKGTSIVVNNLFKNVPVRRQYYNNSKRRKEELKKVEDLMLAFCIAAPDVHFTFLHDKNNMVQKSSAQGIQQSLMILFPTVYKKMKSESREVEDIKLEVYLPNPSFANDQSVSRSCADRLFVIVNGRPVNHKSIEKLVKAHFIQTSEGCHGRYPMGVISVILPAADIDVNLEPNKNKVLLKNEDTVLESLKDILENIYGPLELTAKSSQKKSASQANSIDTDITCTLACITQKQGTDPTSREEEMEILDEFLKESLNGKAGNEEKAEVAPRLEKRLSSEHCMFNDKENDSFFENCRITSFDNVNREKQCPLTPQMKDQFLRPERTVDESIVDVGKSHLTSTQLSKSNLIDRSRPSLSLSTVRSVGSSYKSDPSIDPNMSFTPCGTVVADKSGLSSIKPLSLPSSSESNLQLGERKEKCSEEDLDESLQISSIRNKDQRTQPSSGNEVSSQLHTTVMGSDGIPVFKIMPLEEEDVISEDEDPGAHKQSFCNDNTSCDNRKEVPNDAINAAALPSDASSASTLQEKGIQEKDGLVNGDVEKNSAGSWSRGHISMAGNNIQTVQLARPNTGTNSPPKQQPTANAFKRLLAPPSPGKQLSPVPSKKVKHEALSPTSYEYVNGKSVKRPASAFILYSRDIRRTVLQENPGKDFAFIAKTMADRWKGADPEIKQHYKDLSEAESKRYQEEMKKVREIRSMNDSILDRSNISRSTLDKFVAPHTPILTKNKGEKSKKQSEEENKRPWLNKAKDFIVDIEKIQEKLKTPTSTDLCGQFQLIGPLSKSGSWLCQENGVILALNTGRLHEAILAQTLLHSFTLKPKDLTDPVVFNASSLGSQEWTALSKMGMDLQEDRNFYVVNDKRLLANGFKVVIYKASNGDALSHGEIVGMANCIGFYGINDLKEILSIIASNPSASLARSRPLKVQHWLKGEAVRMMRSGPNIIEKEDVLDKLEQWQRMQGLGEQSLCPAQWKKRTCLHKKLIFTNVFSLDDVPASQSQD